MQTAFVTPHSEAARLIGISMPLLSHWVKTKRIPYREKEGRYFFRPVDVKKFRTAWRCLNRHKFPTNGSKEKGRRLKIKEAAERITK